MFFIYHFFIAGCHYFYTCSDHGSCSNVGTCQCDEGFYGDSCSSKHNKLLLVFSFSRFLGVAEWSMFEWNQFNKYCKNIRIIEIKFTHWLFFHFFTSCTKRYGNRVIFLFFFMFSLFQKNVLASTIPLNELELFINCWDFG